MEEINANLDNQKSARFSIANIYLKDVSLEAPNSPAAFAGGEEWDSKVSLKYSLSHNNFAENAYEVTLTLTVTAKADDKTVFLVELEQAGIFMHKNSDEQTLNRLLYIRWPNILFPYAREAIDSLIVKSGFPALMLGPVNFSAAYSNQVDDSMPPEESSK